MPVDSHTEIRSACDRQFAFFAPFTTKLLLPTTDGQGTTNGSMTVHYGLTTTATALRPWTEADLLRSTISRSLAARPREPIVQR